MQNGLRKGEHNLLFNNLLYLQNQCSILGFHIFSVYSSFVCLVPGIIKCIILGDFICPIAKLQFWLNIIAEIFLCSSDFGHMCVRKVFELQT